jgi:hypothetical protein
MTTHTGTFEHVIGRDGLFVLRLHDGDTHLTGVDGDRVTIRPDGGSLDGFEIQRGERSLELRVGHGPGPRDSDRATRRSSRSTDLTIELPTGATVILEAGSADVVARHLTGDVRLLTGSGDLTIEDVSGTLSAEAVSGDIEIEARDTLTLVARTVSGDLGIRARTLDGLRATTTSGDLSISGRFVGDGPFLIETVSGDALLRTRGDVRVDVTTLTGDIHGPDIGHRSSRDRGPIVIGSGDGPTIVFRSTSGDLSIDPRDDDDRRPESRIEPAPAAEPADPAESAEPADPATDPTLAVLRALERGEIDVDIADRRLAALDTDGADDADESDGQEHTHGR